MYIEEEKEKHWEENKNRERILKLLFRKYHSV